MPRWPGFVGPSSVSQSPQADCEQTYNFYIEQLTSRAAKAQLAFYPSPGFQTFTRVPEVGGRALYEMNGSCLGVMGGTAYAFDALGTPTSLGAVTQDAFQAQIVGNGAVGAQFLFASGTNAYCYTPASNTFTQVLTGDATMIGMLDGFGIALNPTTSKIRISNLNDFSTWSSLQFAQRGDAPDNWSAMVVNIPDIWLIGQQTGVVWYDAGSFPFPLAPRPGATFKYGIVAPWTLKSGGGAVLWLARNQEGAGVVVQAVGYSPQRVSTPEVETAIANYARTSSITDAEALMFQYQGHTFYVLTFPSANATWVLDLNTGLWVNWGKWNAAMTRYDIWQPRVHCYAFGQHLTASRTTPTVAAMDAAFTTEENGDVIRRMRITPALFQEYRMLPIRKVEVLLESGLGTISGAGTDPLITLASSDDGGKTYLPERSASAGAIGRYDTRASWWRCGIPRNRVNKFVMTDPIPWRVLDCFFNNDEPQENAPGVRDRQAL